MISSHEAEDLVKQQLLKLEEEKLLKVQKQKEKDARTYENYIDDPSLQDDLKFIETKIKCTVVNRMTSITMHWREFTKYSNHEPIMGILRHLGYDVAYLSERVNAYDDEYTGIIISWKS